MKFNRNSNIFIQENALKKLKELGTQRPKCRENPIFGTFVKIKSFGTDQCIDSLKSFRFKNAKIRTSPHLKKADTTTTVSMRKEYQLSRYL